MDREKVIKAVEEAFDLVHSDFIGTDDFNEKEWEQNKADAIELLKEQEAEPEIEGGGSTWFYVCSECRGAIDDSDRYCRHCGARMKGR